MKLEIRACTPMELREENKTIKVAGYAAVFNTETNVGGSFREEIAPGAFSEAVKSDNVVFVINHGGLPLARTSSGTLSLREDTKGLYMETELDPQDPDVQSILPKMKRGDLTEMSFAFIPEKQDWDESEDIPKRTITKAKLFDVSIVTSPQYEGTEIGLRCLQDFREKENPSVSPQTLIRLSKKLALSKRKPG